MKIDLTGRAFIQKEEGLRLKAYLCSAGVPTIGYGNTFYSDGRRVKLGDSITRQQADELFTDVVENFEIAVSRGVKVPLTQNQFNALVSFAFNVGVGAFLGSTLLKKINAKASYDEIKAQFLRWNKAGGLVNKGLDGRRKREAALFGKGG